MNDWNRTYVWRVVTPQEEINACLELMFGIVRGVTRLNPTAYITRGEDEKRGGFPPGPSSGRRGSDRPIPVGEDGGPKDRHDRTIDRENKAYVGTFREMHRLTAVQENREAERGKVLDPVTASELALEDARRGSEQCQTCGEFVFRTANDRLRSGRCRWCYEWKRRTGDDPTPADIEEHVYRQT